MCHSQAERPKKITYVSDILSDIFRTNLRLKVFGAGLVLLIPVSPAKPEVDYRPASFASTAFLVPFLESNNRMVAIKEESDLIILCTQQDPFFTSFTEPLKDSLTAMGIC